MSMTEWARREVELACKRENPNWDGKSFDYGCSCYASALKAYECLMADGHSGYSFSVTAGILKTLLDSKPLTPITDEDFPNRDQDNSDDPNSYEHDRGIKSSIQCPRMYSLFREESIDGVITYHDNNRVYCVDIETPSDTFHGFGTKLVDELYPITMPYWGTEGHYKVYVQTFLCDRNNGDFDHRGIIYIETPSGERVDINKYYKDGPGPNGWVEISFEEYMKDEENRLDKPEAKTADHIWSCIEWDSIDRVYDMFLDAELKLKKSYRDLLNTYRPEIPEQVKQEFQNYCKYFKNHPEYNTWDIHRSIARGEMPNIKEISDGDTISAFKNMIDLITPYIELYKNAADRMTNDLNKKLEEQKNSIENEKC